MSPLHVHPTQILTHDPHDLIVPPPLVDSVNNPLPSLPSASSSFKLCSANVGAFFSFFCIITSRLSWWYLVMAEPGSREWTSSYRECVRPGVWVIGGAEGWIFLRHLGSGLGLGLGNLRWSLRSRDCGQCVG